MHQTSLKETEEGLFLSLPQCVLDKLGASLGNEVELTPLINGFLIEPLSEQEQ